MPFSRKGKEIGYEKVSVFFVIRNELQSTIKSWREFFIIGDRSVISDREWDDYLQKLNTAGLQEYLTIAQQTYDQMYPNGHVKK